MTEVHAGNPGRQGAGISVRSTTLSTGKLSEIGEELRMVLTGRGNVADSIVPPVLFFAVNALAGFGPALWAALLAALLITVLRVSRHQSLGYALVGLAAVALSVGVAKVSGRAGGFFLPGVLTDLLTVTLCMASVLVGRPLVALTSAVIRRWPLRWYWHPRVRPAYSEVTWIWGLFFVARTALHLALLQGSSGALAVIAVVTDWPSTILLLVVSYLYGTWRLRNLGGPSVEEFKLGAAPPWEGQRRGF
jgi:hypothetical protein